MEKKCQWHNVANAFKLWKEMTKKYRKKNTNSRKHVLKATNTQQKVFSVKIIWSGKAFSNKVALFRLF